MDIKARQTGGRMRIEEVMRNWEAQKKEDDKKKAPLPKRFWDSRKKRSPRYKAPKTQYTPQGEQIIAERRNLTETDWLEEKIKWECVIEVEK